MTNLHIRVWGRGQGPDNKVSVHGRVDQQVVALYSTTDTKLLKNQPFGVLEELTIRLLPWS